MALHGDTAVIGAPLDDAAAGGATRSAYGFLRDGSGTWSQQAKLEAPDAAAHDFLGTSVALAGETAVVGAAGDDTAAGTNAGSVYVFVRDGSGTWSQQAKLEAADGAAGDFFGTSVARAGDTALVGAPLHDMLGHSDGVAVCLRTGRLGDLEPAGQASDCRCRRRFLRDLGCAGRGHGGGRRPRR